MPIQIKGYGSLDEVNRQLRTIENEYEKSSQDFLANPESVPEFDAIEWNFLLMQKRAIEDLEREDNRYKYT